MLEKLAVGESEAARKGCAFVEFALKDIPFTRPHELGAADEFREKASALILELMK